MKTLQCLTVYAAITLALRTVAFGQNRIEIKSISDTGRVTTDTDGRLIH